MTLGSLSQTEARGVAYKRALQTSKFPCALHIANSHHFYEVMVNAPSFLTEQDVGQQFSLRSKFSVSSLTIL